MVVLDRKAHSVREQSVSDDAQRLAVLVNADLGSIADGAKQILNAIANVDVVSNGQTTACNAYLRSLATGAPRYTEIVVADVNGDITCASTQAPPDLNIRTRPHFQRAIQQREFIIGDYVVGLISGKPIVPFAAPILNAEGQLSAVAIATLNLDWLSDRLQGMSLPHDAIVEVADRNGITLAQHPVVADARGRTLPGSLLALLNRPVPGSAIVRHYDGRERITGFVPWSVEPTGLFVSVGYDRALIESELNGLQARDALLLLACAAFAVFTTWFAARRFIGRPVAALLDVAERWHAGEKNIWARDRSYLTGAGSASEFGRLATALDQISKTASDQERATQFANERFRAVAEAIPGLVFSTDAAGRNTFTNTQYQTFAGMTARELLGDGWTTIVHPDDQKRAAIAWEAAVQRSAIYEVEYRLRRSDGEYRWFLTRAVPARDSEGSIAAWLGFCTDIHDVKAAELTIRSSEERFRLAAEGAGMATWDYNPASGELVWSRPLFDQLGLRPHPDGKADLETWTRCLHPDDVTMVRAARVKAERTGAVYHTVHRIIRADSGETRWRENFGRFVTTASGIRFLGVAFDVTERKEMEERQLLLMREVDHRAKNALAVALAVVKLTRAETMDEYVRAVEGRVAALSHAHELLAKSRWSGADLRRIAEEEFAAYRGGGRIVISGPAILLAPAAVQPFSMLLHELVTNAAKHGALSSPDGKISLDWHVDSATSDLRLSWREYGGPRLTGAPSRRGFGTTLIVATLEKQLDGALAYNWLPDGLQCDISVGAAHAQRMTSEADTVIEDPAIDGVSLLGSRVLLVEDETLVALEIQDSLQDLGCTIIGPAATIAEARRMVSKEMPIDVAMLDINLRGNKSFEIAQHLASVGVPFFFASGYSELPPEWEGKAILLKKPYSAASLRDALRRCLIGQSFGR
jgi:PAS domain S-box-containing protein